MATNHILQFAPTVTDTNLLSQAEYASDEQRLIGNQPGIARSALVNKALRQCSTMAAGLGQYLATRQTADVTDSLTPDAIAAMLASVISASGGGGGGGGSTGIEFATPADVNNLIVMDKAIAPGTLGYAFRNSPNPASGYLRMPNTMMFQWGAVSGSSGTARFATSFPIGCFIVIASGYSAAPAGAQLVNVVANNFTQTGFNYDVRQGATSVTASFRYLAFGA